MLEIYFVDYYNGALHYYSIKVLSSLCQSHLGSPFHCQVLSRESRWVVVIQSARLGQVHVPVSYLFFKFDPPPTLIIGSQLFSNFSPFHTPFHEHFFPSWSHSFLQSSSWKSPDQKYLQYHGSVTVFTSLQSLTTARSDPASAPRMMMSEREDFIVVV